MSRQSGSVFLLSVAVATLPSGVALAEDHKLNRQTTTKENNPCQK